jgi:hypothetical protein
VTAIYQHIVYNEYIPQLIGINYTASLGLSSNGTSSFFHGYDPSANATISAEFATAALRHGHTVVRNQFHRYLNQNYTTTQSTMNLSSLMADTSLAYT